MIKRNFKLALLAATVSMCCVVHAQDVIVKTGETEFERISLNDLRKLTFSDGKLTIEKTSGSEQLTIPLSDILLDFTAANGSSLPAVVAGNLQVYQKEDVLYVTNDQSIGRIQLINLQGLTFASLHTAGQTATLNISGLPAGVYILKVENTVTKFIKK